MTISKTSLVPLGIAVASALFLSGLCWKAASWTTHVDGRLAAIELNLGKLLEARGLTYQNYLSPAKEKNL